MQGRIQVRMQIVCLTILVLVRTLGYAQMASQQPLSREQAPIAMSASPSGTLIVLGSRGSLSVVYAEKGVTIPIKQSLGYYNPADMTTANRAGRDVILVTMYSNYAMTQQSAERRGILAEYSLAGEQTRVWPFAGRVFDAITVDPNRGTVYLGEGLRGQISTLSLEDKKDGGEPKFLVELPGVSRLGALALDPDRQKLFVADAEQGRVFVIDVEKRRTRTLINSIGEPAALTYDRGRHMLYVADAARRCIWRLAVDEGTPTQPTVFSSAPELREPRGIAVDSEHNVWVADFGASAVFELGARGEVVKKLRP
jgi:hypothetical protein